MLPAGAVRRLPHWFYDALGLTTNYWQVFNTEASGHSQVHNVNGDFIQHVYTASKDQGTSFQFLQKSYTNVIGSKEAKEIYRWLAAPDTSGNYNAAREKHHAMTGAWLIEGKEFSHWKETPGSALWIYGTRESDAMVSSDQVLIIALHSGMW